MGLAALAVLATFTLEWTEKAMQKQLDARAKESSAAAAAFVQARLDVVSSDLESFAARPEFVAAVSTRSPQMSATLAELKALNATVSVVSVLDLSGRMVATTAQPTFVGQDFSYRDYFRGVVQTGHTYVSTAYVGVQAGQGLMTNVITPIRTSAASAPVGYLTAAQSLTRIQEYVRSFAKAAGLRVTVTDQSGVTVASTDPRPLGRVDFANAAWLQDALSGRSGTTTAELPSGKVLVSYGQTASGWVVAAALPRSAVVSPMRQLRGSIMLLAVTLGMVILVAGILMRRITSEREQAIADLEVARTDLAAAVDQLRAEAQERQRFAREMNDTIVQGLVSAEMSYDLGEGEHARDLLRTVSRQARSWVGQLLKDSGPVVAGVARLREKGPDSNGGSR